MKKYTTPGDVVTNYDIRTLTTQRPREEDELISREYSTKGVLETLAESYCTLSKAIRNDKFVILDADSIPTYSLKAYETICDILSNDLNIIVNSPGKGITIKAVDRNMDLDR